MGEFVENLTFEGTLVPIDGLLNPCYKLFSEKNPKGPWDKVERNQFERVTDQIGHSACLTIVLFAFVQDL
jgi:hypothetical protein